MRAIALTLLLSTSFAFAQGTEATPEEVEGEDANARARALFGEGVAHAGEGRFAEAAAAFRAALELRNAPAIEYNLARALVEVGESGEAYRRAASAATSPEASEDVRRDAEALMRELRAQLSVVTISLGGHADGIRIDGRDIPTTEIERPLVLAPGQHEIVGLRGGVEVSRRTLTLRAGVETFVDVSVVETPREAAEATPPIDGEQPQRNRTALIVGVAAGVAAAVIITVIIAVVAGGGTQSPVGGDFEPGVIRW